MSGSFLCPILRGVPTPHRRHQGEVGGTHILTGMSWSQTWGSKQPAPLHLQAGSVWFARMVAEECGRAQGTRRQDRHFRSAVPCLQVPPWAQASWLHRWLLCFAALGQLGWTAPLGKRGTKSLLCPQQHGHITASMVLKSACNNQVESTLPVQCPHGAVHVHP